MSLARFSVAAFVLAGAALAACGGSFGSGTTPPNALIPSGSLSGIAPTPSPTPAAANNIVTCCATTAFQPLASAAGYGGAIAFPVPSPKPSNYADVAIGATISVTLPTDTPDLNLLTKGKKAQKRSRPARSLVYVTLLATHDVSLDSYPRIAIDVPRDIVTTYRENEFGLALYNAGTKDTAFKLAVSELDTVATPPPTPSPNPKAPGAPTPIPLSASAVPSGSVTATPSALPSGVTPAPGTSGAPGAIAPSASPTLPPQRITFAGTAMPIKLYANRPVTFALYALPIATPSPSPSPKASGKAAAESESAASPSASATAQASGPVAPSSPSGPSSPSAPVVPAPSAPAPHAS